MVIFYIISRGTHPYGKHSEANNNIVNGKKNLSAVEDAMACDLVEQMLAMTPSDRPSARVLLE